jgi:hypothetical protein
MTLNPGEAAFVNNTSASAIDVTLVGEVPQGSASNVSVAAGFSLIGSIVPQSGALDAELGFPAGLGDTFYLFDNGANQYVSYSYSFTGFGGNPPVPSVGEGFFVNKAAAADWNRDFSVNN